MKHIKNPALLAVSCIAMFGLSGCGSANREYIKERAEQRWEEVGFRVIGYEGYQWGFWIGGKWGGACVWYMLEPVKSNGIHYSGYLQRWGDELHVYGPKAIDAIKPNN